MDDSDLRTLGRSPLGPGGEPRPVADVLARGRRVRRRAALARAVPVVLVVALVAAGAGALAQADRDGGPDDVATGPPGRTVPLPPQTCEGFVPEPVPADRTDGLRLVPTDLPAGVVVDRAESQQVPLGTCVVVDPALVLRAFDGNEIEAEIVLEGPFDEPYRGVDDEVVLEPTELRGRDASRTVRVAPPDASLGFAWTEPDGRSWLLTGVGASEGAVRVVAERLDLDGGRSPDDPVAALPDGAVPPDYEVTWQAPGLPAVEGEAQLEVDVTTDPPLPSGCTVTVRTTDLRAPAGRMRDAIPDARVSRVEVRGGQGFAVEDGGTTHLSWTEAPGVVGELRCGVDVEATVRVADSLAQLPSDDPRIAGGLGG